MTVNKDVQFEIPRGNSEKLSAEEVSLLQRFKNKATEFMAALNRLNAITNVPPNLQDEYNTLQGQATIVQGSIGWITETVDTVTGFFSDVFQFDGVSAVRSYINNETPNTLGFAPLIPVAVISGALAAMGKFISDVYLFERKVTEQQRLVAGGMPESQAADVVSQITGKGITANLADLAKPVAFALGAMIVLRMMRGVNL